MFFDNKPCTCLIKTPEIDPLIFWALQLVVLKVTYNLTSSPSIFHDNTLHKTYYEVNPEHFVGRPAKAAVDLWTKWHSPAKTLLHMIATLDHVVCKRCFTVSLQVTCSHVSDEKQGIPDILLTKPIHSGISTKQSG